jgi:hypothetical protein
VVRPVRRCCQQGLTTFLPTRQELLDLARLMELGLKDPAVVAAFDELVPGGHLKPFVPDWWGLSRQLALRLSHCPAPASIGTGWCVICGYPDRSAAISSGRPWPG